MTSSGRWRHHAPRGCASSTTIRRPGRPTPSLPGRDARSPRARSCSLASRGAGDRRLPALGLPFRAGGRDRSDAGRACSPPCVPARGAAIGEVADERRRRSHGRARRRRSSAGAGGSPRASGRGRDPLVAPFPIVGACVPVLTAASRRTVIGTAFRKPRTTIVTLAAELPVRFNGRGRPAGPGIPHGGLGASRVVEVANGHPDRMTPMDPGLSMIRP
jgi:hypothetical protein